MWLVSRCAGRCTRRDLEITHARLLTSQRQNLTSSEERLIEPCILSRNVICNAYCTYPDHIEAHVHVSPFLHSCCMRGCNKCLRRYFVHMQLLTCTTPSPCRITESFIKNAMTDGRFYTRKILDHTPNTPTSRDTLRRCQTW